ncbi:MAG: L-dopachrome tautomerase-related protein [Gemmatimonadota bacterium]
MSDEHTSSFGEAGVGKRAVGYQKGRPQFALAASPIASYRMGKNVVQVAVLLAALTVLGAVGLKARFGGGTYYPDVSTAPLMGSENLEVVLSYEEPIGNVAVSTAGRIFFTAHPEARPKGAKLLEWRNGEAVPYPSAGAQDSLLGSILGLAIDRQNRLWTVDHGMHGLRRAKLHAFDLAGDSLVHEMVFPGQVAPPGSYLQDLQIDPAGRTVYVADVSFLRGSPAIVVYDIDSGASWRILEEHESVVPQDWIIRSPLKEMTFLRGLVVLKPGVDGIALDRSGEWLYYGAMAHESLYRVRTSDIHEPRLTPLGLTARIEEVGHKPLSDGLSIDNAGNVYVTDVEHSGVMRVGVDGTLQTVIRSARIRWADALSYGPGGWLYVADSALPDHMLRSRKHIQASAPYYVFRFRPGTAGTPGQ